METKIMKECDKRSSRVSSNFIRFIYLVIMLDTLLLKHSLHFTTLHFTTLVDTSLPLI